MSRRSVILRRQLAVKRDPVCGVPWCSKPHRAMGLCSMHYGWMHRTGSPIPPARPVSLDLCACDVDVVRVYLCHAGAVACERCHRPPLETMGIHWTAELLASHRANPRVATGT